MTQQFIITGNVEFAGEGILEGRVEAFDRDLPSLEQRGATPQLLGQSPIDNNFRFRIEFTDEQFRRGEGETVSLLKASKISPDLSFRVFDATGRELKIGRIVAQNREYRPDQIIFNAPPNLEEIRIRVEPAPAVGDSEYERLVAAIAPVIQDIPLAGLTEDDVIFLINELGFEQQLDIQQQIQWLRRSALLASQTDLPIEAFYGWGRVNIPSDFAELVATPLTELQPFLKQLLAETDDRLRGGLRTAISDKIIPDLGDRIDAIVRQLKRRDQVLHKVVAQLLDEETKAVLAGYTVTTFDQDAVGENRGLDITDNEGQFSFAFYAPKEIPPNAPPREFRLEVHPPQGEKLPEDGHVSVNPNQPETEILPALIKVPKPEISKQQEQLKSVLLDAPPELRTFLNERQNIQTLADIRRKGGLSHLADLPAEADPAFISQLESLADLDRISPDISVSETLRSQDFDSVLAISDTPHSEFVGKLTQGDSALSELDAAKLHGMASAQNHLLDNMLMRRATNNANGFKLPGANGADPAADVFQQPCGCSDCEAAVSPAAYLTALLDYALKHIRKEKKKILLPFLVKIDLQFLANTFHQPFIDLPTDCEAVEKQLRQVRICIEVLRSYLGNRPLANSVKEVALTKGESDYRFAVYAMLLNRIGTSYEEIRRVRSETNENRKALAERLGIDLTAPRPSDLPNDDEQNGDELDRLFLDPSAKPPQDHLLTEQVVEKLFGLGDTTRDPLSEGAKLGDARSQIGRWNLNGVVWGQNTDPEGMVHVTLVNPAPNVFRVELYQNLLRTKLVAAGEIATATGTVKLLPESNSHLSGVFEIAYTVDSKVISIAALPAFLSWQLKHLRTLWSRQDHPIDAYSDDESPRLPIIDPDLLGPDDFRNPNPKINPADPNRAFDIWLKRWTFIDTTLKDLKTNRETKGLTAILKQVLGNSSLPGNPLPDLDGLLLLLTKGGTADEIKTAKDSVTALALTLESFTRLMSIRAKDQLAQSDPRNDKVSEQEWREVYSILTQALKAKQFDAWRTEEQGAGIRIGLEEFWFSLTEPKEGDWPPVPVEDQPFIDPGIVKLTDLPDWLAGKEAISLWNARKARIEQIPKDLKTEREINGFDAMLRLALGNPLPGNALQHNLNTLKNSLSNADETIRSKAIKQIETDLHLTVENFKRLMGIKVANDQPDPAKKPTAAEFAEIYAILSLARKLKHEYPQWVQQEKTAGLVYWKALKAKLPRWQASSESRQGWQQALRVRSQPPIIDPTVMGTDDLQHVIPGDTAFDVWKERYDRIAVLRDGLKTTREAAPDTLAGLDRIIKEALGFESADLESIDRERQAGYSVEKRLEQLNLINSAFNYLMRIRGLAKANQPITDSEWGIVYATLAQAKIQREFAEMRAQEQEKHIILSPDLFKIPKALLTPLPFLELSTPRWLSTWQARRDWQDMLQSRIDREDSIVEGLRNAIGAVEEATLPALRDALIEASNAVGVNFNEQAEWITARLLIDARSGGCRMTTRVAQALETLQTLIFDLRTGQFKQLVASPLSLVSDYFDEEWKWIGSYATWRSAMFVFLYPENILQPSLLKNKTPVFEALIKKTRGLRLNPQQACSEAETYANYFRDICSLKIEATCQASTIIYTGEGCDRQKTNARSSIFYMFGRATSGKIYWSTYDPGGNSSAYSQTFWKEVSVFNDAKSKVVRIIGAMPYRKINTDVITSTGFEIISSYIYLFCLTSDGNKKALMFARLNLDENGAWVDLKELGQPPLQYSISKTEIVPVQTQSEFSPPALVFHENESNQFYYRTLDTNGTAWSQGDWPSFLSILPTSRYNPDSRWKELKAVLTINAYTWFLRSDRFSGLILELALVVGGGQTVKFEISLDRAIPAEDLLGAIPGRGFLEGGTLNNDIYIFWRDKTSGTSNYQLITGKKNNNSPIHEALVDLIEIPPNSGSALLGQQMVAYKRNKNAQAFYMYQYTEAKDKLVGSATLRAVPRVNAPLNLPLHLSATNLQQRRQDIIKAFALNADATASVLQYLREAYYFVPIHLALGLQSAGHYLAALDCFRTVYDYEARSGTPNQRNIYYGLELDAKLLDVPLYQQADGWLLDPLNPHSIAATRHFTYTRFTIMSLVRCLLDFADSEFTQETGESLAKARTLYLTALDLLNLPELQQKLGKCDDLIAELKIEPGKDIPPEVPAAIGEILEELTRVPLGKSLDKASKDVKAALQGASAWNARLTEARAVVNAAVADAPSSPTTGAMVISKSNILREQHALLLMQPLIDDSLQVVGKTVVKNMFAGIGLVDPVIPPSNGKLPEAPPQPLVSPLITPSLKFCIPPNPILRALRLHAELNLYKLRTCRNIAGLKRQLDAYAAPTDTTTGLPAIGAGGQLTLPGIATLQPSLYRYPVLIERAKQLVQLAAQIEGAMLSSLINRDAEARTLLEAGQQLSLAQAGVRLQDLRVGEANDGVTLVDLQQERVQIQINTYDTWIQTGANEYENQMIDAYGTAAAAQRRSTDDSSLIQEKQALIAAAQLTAQIAAANPYAAAAVGLTSIAIDTALFIDQNANLRDAINATAAAQIASVNAALERRKDEWQLQKRLAEQDSLIGDQQKKIATDHVQIATQERVIAGIGADNAKDTVEFLTNKFTNVELFDWMSNILEGVYSYFLQQATAMATLAGNQLAFERQEVPPAFINSDYWNVPSESSTLGNTADKTTDRRGLTGSARLLQDIYQLDQYAFATNKRKLPLTKTISLARLAPFEFQRFRETGVMLFATPMELFDRGFPGHYLRLIKRVRTSVIALIPPIDGIHATLSTTGPSRVVIGGDVFQTVPIRRAPEFIALSAPNNSTGVFELDPQSDMLLPFEGSGVEMSWEFNMPKAANRFDYRTIADVLITLEYNALYSFDYRQQVIQSLKPTVSADRPFSLRSQFADQWYDLNNPDQTKTPMKVKFQTIREDFPPNVETLKIQQVLLYFVRASQKTFELPITTLRFTEQGNQGTVGGSATPIDGKISTRSGNAGSWTAMIGKNPVGEWELTLPNTEEVKKHFLDEEIDDILFVITYAGRTPEWPA
jgi:Tc toxin complex TcA C-terminal TcB-binding domain